MLQILHLLHQRLTILEARPDRDIAELTPMSHPIIPDEKEKFLSKCDVSVREAMRKLLDNTIHVSYEDLMKYIVRGVKAFIEFYKAYADEHRGANKIYLFMDKESYMRKNKSNSWITAIVEKQIRKIVPTMQIEYIHDLSTVDFKDDDVILFPDDCAYTGSQMGDLIASTRNTKLKKIHFYMLIPVITNTAKDNIENEFRHNGTLHGYCDITFFLRGALFITQNANSFLSADEIQAIENMYSMSFEVNEKYLIYFDHKIADDVSTIPLIYSGLVANKHNQDTLKQIRHINTSIWVCQGKTKLEELKKQQQKKIDELDYHNFLDKLHETRNFNQSRPEYPPPPYKRKAGEESMHEKFTREQHLRRKEQGYTRLLPDDKPDTKPPSTPVPYETFEEAKTDLHNEESGKRRRSVMVEDSDVMSPKMKRFHTSAMFELGLHVFTDDK